MRVASIVVFASWLMCAFCRCEGRDNDFSVYSYKSVPTKTKNCHLFGNDLQVPFSAHEQAHDAPRFQVCAGMSSPFIVRLTWLEQQLLHPIIRMRVYTFIMLLVWKIPALGHTAPQSFGGRHIGCSFSCMNEVHRARMYLGLHMWLSWAPSPQSGDSALTFRPGDHQARPERKLSISISLCWANLGICGSGFKYVRSIFLGSIN